MKLMKLYKAFIAPILLVIISLLLGILLLIQINQGQKQVRQTTAILLDQIKSVIEDNQSRESLLVEVLKEEQPIHEEFTYVSMDLNGLKRVNDTLGHDAGDELIKGAALCMRESFGSYGDLFRIGGDEFAAIMDVDDQRLQQALDDFQRRTGNWRGGLVDRLSVSCGCARRAEFPEKALADLAKIADIRMYQAKREYYRAAGMDRREQPFTDGR